MQTCKHSSLGTKTSYPGPQSVELGFQCVEPGPQSSKAKGPMEQGHPDELLAWGGGRGAKVPYPGSLSVERDF